MTFHFFFFIECILHNLNPFYHHHPQYPPSNPNPFTHPTLDFNNKHPIAFT